MAAGLLIGMSAGAAPARARKAALMLVICLMALFN
jgi:hypothetical protein